MYTTNSNHLIKLPKVIEITGHSRSSIYAGVKDGTFPSPLKIGKRSVAWKYSAIENWLASLQPSNTCKTLKLISEDNHV